MNNSSSAQVWALLTVFVGFGVAVPFLKRPTKQLPKLHGNSANTQQFREQRIVSGRLPEVPANPSLHNDEALVAYVREQLQERPTLVQMPDWATPESGLDILMQTGAQSVAPAHAPQELGELQALVPGPADRRHQEVANEAFDGEAPSLAAVSSSPWSNQHKVPNYITTGGEGPAPTWADDVFAARARLWHDEPNLPPSVAEFAQHPDVGKLASGTIATAQSVSSVPPQQPAEDRRRRFVYQPGIQMPED